LVWEIWVQVSEVSAYLLYCVCSLLMVCCFIAPLYEFTGWTNIHILSGRLLLLWLLNFCSSLVWRRLLIDLVYIGPKHVTWLSPSNWLRWLEIRANWIPEYGSLILTCTEIFPGVWFDFSWPMLSAFSRTNLLNLKMLEHDPNLKWLDPDQTLKWSNLGWDDVPGWNRLFLLFHVNKCKRVRMGVSVLSWWSLCVCFRMQNVILLRWSMLRGVELEYLSSNTND